MPALGPQTANYVTARPSTATVVSAADTWFADCTSAAANDGTVFSASWLNVIIAQLRQAIDDAIANGATITRADSNDSMLSLAIRHFATTAASAYTAAASAPASPTVKDLWLDTTSGGLFIYASDGTTSAWVQIA